MTPGGADLKRTLPREAAFSGVGVHSGRPVRLVLRPSETGTIVFRRADLGGAEMALGEGSIEARNSTSLVGPRFAVRTVEHLLASLAAFGIDSLVVELDGEEVPILDGSAKPFAEALAGSGSRPVPLPRTGLEIREAFAVEEGDASVRFEPGPGPGLRLSCAIAYPHPAIGAQTLELPFAAATFVREIAPARTFGFLRDVDALRARGLARGASYENTIVLDEAGVVSGPLRFPDEFVRHKLLDLAGDLALLAEPLAGRVAARKAGHRLHVRAVRELLARPAAWRRLSLSRPPEIE